MQTINLSLGLLSQGQYLHIKTNKIDNLARAFFIYGYLLSALPVGDKRVRHWLKDNISPFKSNFLVCKWDMWVFMINARLVEDFFTEIVAQQQ